MRAREFVREIAVGHILTPRFEIVVDDHALERARERGVDPRAVDYIIRTQLPKVSRKLDQIEVNQKFWVYDWSRELSLGLRRLSSTEPRFLLKTVWPGRPARTPEAEQIVSINESVGADYEKVAENMDHSQDGRAVEELKSALLAKRDQLQSASDDQVYDIIDKIMTRIARSHSISGQKLHDMWVDRYKQIPDTWIMNEDVPQPGDFKLMGQNLFLKNLARNLKQRYPDATVKLSSDRVTAYHNKGDDEALSVMGTEVMDGGYIGVGLDDAFTESFQGVLVPTIKQTTEQLLAANPGTKPALFLSTDNWNPDAWTHITNKLGYRLVADDEQLDENFADGKGPGRPGDSQRHGIPKKATMAELEKAAHAKGRKGQLARWQLNMRRGKKK